MDYILLEIQGPDAEEATAAAVLHGAGIDAFEIISRNSVEELNSSEFTWDLVDESLLADAQEGFTIKAYFERGDEAIDAVKARLDARGFSTRILPVEARDWANDWKRYFRPIAVDRGLVIVPSWEDYTPDADEAVLYMDPGMAFGSGNHETTLFCARYLRQYVREGDLVLDIGTGSGILSLVALKSGAARAIAVDMDPQSVASAKENAAKNRLDDRIDVRQGDLFGVVEEVADLVVSNIFAEIIIGMIPALTKHIKPGGVFIASGILKEKRKNVESALIESGFEILDSDEKGDWAAIAAKRGVH